MTSCKHIGLFDPSLWTNSGEPSINLGDLIIYESIEKIISQIFSESEVIRVSSHKVPESDLLRRVNRCQYIFFGGTNALSSDVLKYNQWKLNVPDRWKWIFSFPVSDVILFGVGWWQYQTSPTVYTSEFYRKLLSPKFYHSVRDEYTRGKLKEMGFRNVLNTGCPTMWDLGGVDVGGRNTDVESCLFTLTDYNRNRAADNMLIGKIVNAYKGQIYFFPQGTEDLNYITTLEAFEANKHRLIILDRTFQAYVDCLANNNLDYIGTRLHAGIKALQTGKSALIIAVDNRATEIGRDTGLPVAERSDFNLIESWCQGQKIFGKITIPQKDIVKWKAQFKP